MTTVDLGAIETNGDEQFVVREDTTVRQRQDGSRAFIEALDTLIYMVIAGVFITAAGAMLGYAIYAFIQSAGGQFRSGFLRAIVALINDLLLVMIMMEVLRTILSYLEEHATSLRPFLFIGIISATRRVLAIGAVAALESPIPKAQTGHPEWALLADLLVNAGVILALAIAVRLVGTSGQTRNPRQEDRSALSVMNQSLRPPHKQ